MPFDSALYYSIRKSITERSEIYIIILHTHLYKRSFIYWRIIIYILACHSVIF
ncbi:MAG: DUF624 domain-containing protein [Prevotellaceae bacterium]|nr:DUF624 domain-containing protein [Candidatus Colivivens equi]